MRVRDDITRAEEADGLEAGYYAVNGRNPDAIARREDVFLASLASKAPTPAGATC